MIEIRYDPISPPTPAEAEVDLQVRDGEESVAVVYFDAITVDFSRRTRDEPWTGGAICVRHPGYYIDEGYLKEARAVAVEVLRRALVEHGACEDADVVRCDECQRLLVAPEIKGAGRVAGVMCAPTHVLTFRSGRVLDVAPEGVATWRSA